MIMIFIIVAPGTMWALRIKDQQQEPGVLALGPGLAMLHEDLAGESDQMVAVMRDIGNDHAGLGKTLGPPDGMFDRPAHRRALAFTGRDGSSCAASQASMAERR